MLQTNGNHHTTLVPHKRSQRSKNGFTTTGRFESQMRSAGQISSDSSSDVFDADGMRPAANGVHRPQLQVPRVTPFRRDRPGFAVGPASREVEGPPVDCIGAHLPTNEDIAMLRPDNTKAGLPCVSVCIMSRADGSFLRLWRPLKKCFTMTAACIRSTCGSSQGAANGRRRRHIPPGRQTSDVIDKTDANPLGGRLIMYSSI
jgi:hypothetical protein